MGQVVVVVNMGHLVEEADILFWSFSSPTQPLSPFSLQVYLPIGYILPLPSLLLSILFSYFSLCVLVLILPRAHLETKI